MLVHRARYDDWTFPKGKHENGETDEQTALREVEEETGLRCQLGPELESTSYVDAQGRNKVVRYWAMTVQVENARQPDDEVDAWQWFAIDEADRILTYPRDRTVLASLQRVV